MYIVCSVLYLHRGLSAFYRHMHGFGATVIISVMIEGMSHEDSVRGIKTQSMPHSTRKDLIILEWIGCAFLGGLGG